MLCDYIQQLAHFRAAVTLRRQQRPFARLDQIGLKSFATQQQQPEVIRARARELRQLGDAKGAAYRASRMGRQADGVVTGRLKAQVEVITEDYLSVYLGSDKWDGRPRFEVTIN